MAALKKAPAKSKKAAPQVATRVMKYIGFRHRAKHSEVFVRCDGKARYKVVREGERVVLQLMDTRINVKNNARALDTRFFRSNVTRIKAVEDALGTRVVVELREDVPYEVKRVGTTIKIHFPNPTS